VSKARLVLIILIATSPIVLLWDGLIVQGALAAGVAIALAITALSLRPGETEFLLSVIRVAAAVIAVPALWMIVQVLPLRALAHPIWTSAEAALGRPLWSSISIDPGASLIALGQYLSFGSIVLVAAAIAVDRTRAEWVLFALTAVGAAIALMLIIRMVFIGIELPQSTQAQAIDCVVMGAVVAAASCLNTFERLQLRHPTPEQPKTRFVLILTACAVALVLCLAAISVSGQRAALIAAGCGVTALLLIVIIRWFAVNAWATIIAAGLAAAVAVLVVAAPATESGRSALLAFSSSPSPVGERVLKDAPVLGTGAQTFALIVPVYREIGDANFISADSTAAATLAVELGRPMLWIITVAVLAAIVFLLRASLHRGRDSFYSAMGAGCLIAMLLLAFVNTGIFGNAAGLISASVLGLAIAQSKSRVLQQLG
jgi:hypothetical protein